MKKRLSRRQLRRIKKNQEESAVRAERRGDPESTGEAEAAGELGPEQRGLVISHFGQQLEIEPLGGGKAGQSFRCHQRTNLEPLVAGDFVIWREGDPFGVVVANLPRRNVLQRPNNFGELRPVAANIDTILIVIAPVPQPFANLIDRYLVAAESMEVRPVLVLNKLDLVTQDRGKELEGLRALYRSIGYDWVEVSSKTGMGMDALEAILREGVSIFVGQSGVGKSALVNRLLPGAQTVEGSLSEGSDKGRHTTTAARLFHFPEGGDLIDSPGIREFGLWHMDSEQLITGFIEFRPFLGRCRFRDCKHEQEPGCHLLQAVEQGEISPRRLESYRQILREL